MVAPGVLVAVDCSQAALRVLSWIYEYRRSRGPIRTAGGAGGAQFDGSPGSLTTGVGSTNLRRVSGAIGGGLFLLTVAAFFRPPLLPAMGRDLSMSVVGLGLLGTIFAIGRLAADFPAGRLSDRIHPGPMMAISGLIVAAGSVVLATAPTALVAYASMFVLGIGSTFVLTTGMAHFARAPRVRRGVAMSAFAAWLLAGQSFGPTAGGSIGEALGWRWAIGAAAVLATVVAVGLLFLRTPLPEGVRRRATGRAGTGVPVPRHVLAVIYLLPAVQFALGGALLQTLIPIVADTELGIGPGVVGVALGLGGVSRFVGAIVAGQVADRVSRKWALVPGQVLQSLGLAAFMLLGTPAAWFGSILLVALGSVGVNVGATVLADLSEDAALGRRLGAFRFTGDAAFVIAPILCGWLYQLGGRGAGTAPLLLFSAVTTLGAWLFIPETGHRKGPVEAPPSTTTEGRSA